MRTVREILGLSQVALAANVGLSPESIKRIENHSLPMSREAAARISGYTGADEDQLLQNSDPSEPLNIWQEPFSKAWFKEVYTAEVSKEAIAFWLRYLDFTVRRVVDTCASEKPRAVHGLIAAIFSAIGKVAADYKLRPTAQHLLWEFIERNWNSKDPLFREQMGAASPWKQSFDFSGLAAPTAGNVKGAKPSKKPKRREP